MPDDLKPGAALVRIRWDKATEEQRAEQGRLMAVARWAKLRGEGVRPRKRRKPRPK